MGGTGATPWYVTSISAFAPRSREDDYTQTQTPDFCHNFASWGGHLELPEPWLPCIYTISPFSSVASGVWPSEAMHLASRNTTGAHGTGCRQGLCPCSWVARESRMQSSSPPLPFPRQTAPTWGLQVAGRSFQLGVWELGLCVTGRWCGRWVLPSAQQPANSHTVSGAAVTAPGGLEKWE